MSKRKKVMLAGVLAVLSFAATGIIRYNNTMQDVASARYEGRRDLAFVELNMVGKSARDYYLNNDQSYEGYCESGILKQATRFSSGEQVMQACNDARSAYALVQILLDERGQQEIFCVEAEKLSVNSDATVYEIDANVLSSTRCEPVVKTYKKLLRGGPYEVVDR